MSFAPTLAAIYSASFDPARGRRGRRGHPLTHDFTPLDLGDDCLLWWDTGSLSAGAVTSWDDRKRGRTLQAAGSGTLNFDGSMVAIPAAGFLFGGNAWDFPYPAELWQVVDQTEAAGSANATSLAYGSGANAVELVYTPGIGGQSSAVVGGNTLFGGDDYHGVHVVRWTIGPSAVAGYLDRKLGIPSSSVPAAPLEPTAVYVGANNQGANLWKGRLGDTVATAALSPAEVNAMWNFMMGRAGL